VRWFPIPVLAQFRIILDSIDEVVPVYLRSVFRMILSDIARGVSWQDPGDLRIRRRSNPESNYPAIDIFLATLQSRVAAIGAARRHVFPHRGWQRAFEGNSCDIQTLKRRAREFLDEGIDCVLSSPPYATALPYIDTQRLSIALLGLATIQEIRGLDAALVGSREVSIRERRALEEAIDENQADLSAEVWNLCKALVEAYDSEVDGFRRQNTPAVVYRYFAGMKQAMTSARKYLRNGGWLAFIVGPNRTTLGGETFVIDTPALLAATGEHIGLQVVEIHELNTYSRYDVHSRNSIRKERLLVMKRP
jgi:site-specific DNA-methyltransferase (cytosine-N4-specific)